MTHLRLVLAMGSTIDHGAVEFHPCTDARFTSDWTALPCRTRHHLTVMEALTELSRVLKALASGIANLLNDAVLAIPLSMLRRKVGLFRGRRSTSRGVTSD
jgi:hypothetical protein